MKNQILALVILSQAALSGSAQANIYLSDSLIASLPSPVKYLNATDISGAAQQESLLGQLNEECSNQPQLAGCELPRLLNQYDDLVKSLNSGNSGVQLADEPAKKSWDLSSILSGNYLELPTEDRATAGLDLMVNMFLLRSQIVAASDKFYESRYLRNGRVSMTPLVSRAYMHGYILSSTPLGALNQVFTNIKCDLNQKGCEVYKSLWGAVCNLVVENNVDQFKTIRKRFNLIIKDQSSESLSRLKFIEAFYRATQEENLTKDILIQRIREIENDGQAGSYEHDYADLTRATLVYGELKSLMSLRENCSPYVIDLSPKAESALKSQLLNTMKQPLDDIERAMQKYAIFNETGGN